MSKIRALLALAPMIALAACGPGGGSTPTPAPAPAPTPSPTPVGTLTITNLQLVNQGGPANNSSPLSNYQALSWDPVSGAVDHYQVYRNGQPYARTSVASFTDANAPDSNIIDLSRGATTYAYSVAAVDARGNEGPRAVPAVYLFRGQAYQSGHDFSYAGTAADYADTTGAPANGPYDIKISYPGTGGFAPVVAPPLAPYDNLELGAFRFFVVDVKVTDTSYQRAELNTFLISRVPPGDAFPWKQVDLFDYCTPVVNAWVTCKIPLSDVTMGTGTLTGSINGNKLTVTSVDSGVPIDVAGFVTGEGVPAGTYILEHDQNGPIGTFTIEGPGINDSTRVASRTLNYQRTSFYKLGMQWSCCDIRTTIYMNNLGFSTN